MRLATLLSSLPLALTVWTSAASATTLSYTGGFQTFTVPVAGTYDIVAYGAQGGDALNGSGGLGAKIGGDFVLASGEVLTIAVGGRGVGIGSSYQGGAGGGASFVIAGTTPLIVAGGGGGGVLGTPGGSGNAGQISGIIGDGGQAAQIVQVVAAVVAF